MHRNRSSTVHTAARSAVHSSQRMIFRPLAGPPSESELSGNCRTLLTMVWPLYPSNAHLRAVWPTRNGTRLLRLWPPYSDKRKIPPNWLTRCLADIPRSVATRDLPFFVAPARHEFSKGHFSPASWPFGCPTRRAFERPREQRSRDKTRSCSPKSRGSTLRLSAQPFAAAESLVSGGIT